jgi:hypothetical protein
MDIHFCDLCGARVTDIDLRGGHGICRQYDVICATCVELGHGKEWLANSQQRQQRQSIPSAQPAPALAASAVAAKAGSPKINEARDRAATLEEDDDAAPVAPQVLDADDADDLDNDDHGTLSAEQTPPSVPVLDNHFATAASSFSAMGAQKNLASNNAGQEDVDETEQGEGLSDESKASPFIGGEKANDISESPFAFSEQSSQANDDQESVSQKDETLPSDRDPIMADKPSQSSTRKATAGSASFKRASGTINKTSSAGTKSANVKSSNKSSETTPRAGSSKSGKVAPKGSGRAKAQNKNKNIIIMSCISVGILLMVMLIGISSMSSPKKAPEALPPMNLSESLKTAIKDAKSSATSALRSEDVSALKAAKTQIQNLKLEINNWGDAATKQGYTDEDLGRYLDLVGFPDVNSLQRNISDMLIRKQSSN